MNALTVVVGSTNPVKSRAASAAVRLAFDAMEPRTVQQDARSGVPDQPYGDEQTRAGAFNRALAARRAYPSADLWIGLEGGVADAAILPGILPVKSARTGEHGPADGGLECMAWAVVLGNVDGELRHGLARTASFRLPDEITRLVRSGVELGEATDRVLGVPDGASSSKRGTGTVGPLTGGALDRTGYYAHALLLALIPFRNPGLGFTDDHDRAADLELRAEAE